MPIIFQCAQCGNDYDNVEFIVDGATSPDQRKCSECNTECCAACIESGLCYECADEKRKADRE